MVSRKEVAFLSHTLLHFQVPVFVNVPGIQITYIKQHSWTDKQLPWHLIFLIYLYPLQEKIFICYIYIHFFLLWNWRLYALGSQMVSHPDSHQAQTCLTSTRCHQSLPSTSWDLGSGHQSRNNKKKPINRRPIKKKLQDVNGKIVS